MTGKSQSALEYMMTYGWAILIIVIVAGALYAMGIFSPSSSTSSTVTGFSGLGSVQAECIGNQGLSIQLGNSIGKTIQIQNLSVTINGQQTSINQQQTISPDGNADFYVPNICPSSSSKYSTTVQVYYTEPGAVFSGPYSSSGTVSGQASTQQLSSTPSVTTVIPLTITNTQDTATPNPYQQLVVIPSQVFGGYAASNFQNVEFFYANGTVIPSWLQNYTVMNATYWLKLQSVPASLTIYIGFVSKSTNLFNNVNIGEAPQISSTYGQYDDGANIFTKYWNFAGNLGHSMPSGWTSTTAFGNNLTVDNGLAIDGEALSGTAATYTGPFAGGTFAYCGKWSITATQHYTAWAAIMFGWATTGMEIGTSPIGTLDLSLHNSTFSYKTASTDINNVYSIVTSSWIYGESITGYVNNVQKRLLPESYANSVQAGIDINPPVNLSVYYIYYNSFPQSSQPPATTFGQPSSVTKPPNIQTFVPIAVSNNQNTSILNFQQPIDLPSSVFSGYAASNFQNVEFFYANGTVIPSWLGNYTASNARYWLKLPSLPAYTTFDIYVGFAAETTNLLNGVNVGEAPQLSSTYAQYDNGVNIFDMYFDGDTQISDFSGGSGSNISQATAVGYVSGNINAIYDVAQAYQSSLTFDVPVPAGPYVAESNVESTSAGSETLSWDGLVDNVSASALENGIGAGQCTNICLTSWTNGAQSSPGISYVLKSNYWYYVQIEYPGVSATYYIGSFYDSFNNPALLKHTDNTNPISSKEQFYFGLPTGNGGAVGTTLYFNWGRVREYPPNGVTPSVSFGSTQ